MSDGAGTLPERIDSAIRRNPHLAGRRFSIQEDHGHVVLRGVVNSYYQKQLAQETAWSVDGVDAVENQLEVSWQLPRRAK